MKTKIAFLLPLLLVYVLLASGCVRNANTEGTNTTAQNTSSGESAQIVNSASIYCIQHNGTLVMAHDAYGSEYGICRFPDGSQCEEWAYFRGACQQS